MSRQTSACYSRWMWAPADLSLLNRMHHRWWDATGTSGSYKHNHLSNIWTKSAYRTMDLSLDVWTPSSHSPNTALSIWQQVMPSYIIVWYHSPILTWRPLIAWLPILSSPLSGGFCHAASTTSPPFCLIEIQLGMQTMPISWHQILERAAQENQPQSFPSQSSPRIPPIIMDQRQLVLGIFLCLILLNSHFVRHLGILQHGYL